MAVCGRWPPRWTAPLRLQEKEGSGRLATSPGTRDGGAVNARPGGLVGPRLRSSTLTPTHFPRLGGGTSVKRSASPPSLSHMVSTPATWGVLPSSPPGGVPGLIPSPHGHQKVLLKHPRDRVLPCSKPPVSSAHHGPPEPSTPALASPPCLLPPADTPGAGCSGSPKGDSCLLPCLDVPRPNHMA